MTSSKLAPYFAFLTGLASLAAPGPPAQSLRSFEAVESHMGTLFRIKLYAETEEQATAAFAAAFDRVTKLDNTLSDYQPDSELNLVAQSAVDRPVVVSEDLFRVLSASQKLSAETDGAFDVTIGPLTHLWRQARKVGHPPDDTQLADAKSRCGYRKLHLDTKTRSVKLDVPGMQLDVGAIAKGDAADQALVAIAAHGIRSALVAASGDLAFSDAPPGAAGWQIGIEPADSPESPFTRVLVLTNAAVSTSGASEQHLDSGGVRYSHILNPKTGIALTQQITASVVAPRGIEADGFSTAASVLGVERGLAFIERQPGASLLFLVAEGGKQAVIESVGFKRLKVLP